jgi:hypothetical protein
MIKPNLLIINQIEVLSKTWKNNDYYQHSSLYKILIYYSFVIQGNTT